MFQTSRPGTVAWPVICMTQWRHFKQSCAYGRHKCTNWTLSLSLLSNNIEPSQCHGELLPRNPFAANMETAPINIQMDLIDLHFSGTLKIKYDSEACPSSVYMPLERCLWLEAHICASSISQWWIQIKWHIGDVSEMNSCDTSWESQNRTLLQTWLSSSPEKNA